MSENTAETADVCKYSVAHSVNNVTATTTIDLGQILGVIPACEQCADFYRRMNETTEGRPR